MSGQDEFYRIQKLPPYVFAVINEMKAKARAAQAAPAAERGALVTGFSM